MKDQRKTYESLLAKQNFTDLPVEEALKALGILIDLSLDFHEPQGLKQAIDHSKEIEKRITSPVQTATLFYFLANAWENIRVLRQTDGGQAWDWEQDEFEKAIVYLRSAYQHEGFRELPTEIQCRILTNLGNLLSHIGRFVEAIEYWDRALKLSIDFAMARGNRGYGLVHYAQNLYDKGQAKLLFKRAHRDLSDALSSTQIHEGASAAFTRYRSQIEPIILSTPDIDMNAFPLGASEAEIKYRRWCLENRLFLNPLNDLGPYAIAACDILTAPNIIMRANEGPYYHGFFNQLKQEFVSARYFYYEGTSATTAHYADKDVLLYNTLDYPAYSLSVEKIKVAYRMACSLFDKFAFLLNDYLLLSIDKKSVYLRTLWYSQQKRQKGIRPEFAQRPNWPLRGLYWLAKDLYENDCDFKECLEPEAQELYEIRHHLEHKYLKLHDALWPGSVMTGESAHRRPVDNLAKSLYRRDFEAKTLRILTLARAGLIYLSLSIHQEEKKRAKLMDTKNLLPGISLDKWEDDWKV